MSMEHFIEWTEAELESKLDRMAEAGQEPGWTDTALRAIIADWRRLAAMAGEIEQTPQQPVGRWSTDDTELVFEDVA
jgi:hypothetical protein